RDEARPRTEVLGWIHSVPSGRRLQLATTVTSPARGFCSWLRRTGATSTSRPPTGSAPARSIGNISRGVHSAMSSTERQSTFAGAIVGGRGTASRYLPEIHYQIVARGTAKSHTRDSERPGGFEGSTPRESLAGTPAAPVDRLSVDCLP